MATEREQIQAQAELYSDRMYSLKTLNDLNTLLTWAGVVLSPAAAYLLKQPSLAVGSIISFGAGFTNSLRIEALVGKAKDQFKQINGISDNERKA